jgi:hypothetical protein
MVAGAQEHEFDMENMGYTATRHRREVGAGYFKRRGNLDLRRPRQHPGAREVDGRGAVQGLLSQPGYGL